MPSEAAWYFSRMRSASLILASCIALAGSSARADAVETPSLSCPRGAAPATGHGGPYCRLTVCTSTEECAGSHFWDEEPRTCTSGPIGLCVETRTGYALGGPFQFRAAVAECEEQADCPAGSTCELARRCVAPPLPRWLVITLSIAAAVLAILGALIVFWTRRRKPRAA